MQPSPSAWPNWLRYVLYVPAALLVLLAVVLRSGAPDGQVSVTSFLLVGGLFCVFAVLPGYAIMRVCGLGRGSWIDWLGPSFVVSLMLICAWSIPGYLLGWSLRAGAIFLVAATIAMLAASFFLAGKKGPDSFLQEAPPAAGGAIGALMLALVALAAFNSLRALSPGSDLWFHAGGVTRMARAGVLTTADPFHGSIEPHPMYVMNTWYVLLAVIGRLSGAGAVDVFRVLPALLVPVVISCQASALKLFVDKARDRLLALGLFLAFFTLFSSSMEGSSAPAMWRELTGPRWIALFTFYPVALAWAGRWVLEGGWGRVAAAAAANGVAFFVHPQGGQFCGYVLLFVALAGLLWRDRQWLWRAVAALVLMGIFVLPFVLCRKLLLDTVAGQTGGVSAVGAAGGPVLSTLGEVLGGKYVSRAVELLGSPLWFLGLAAVPLWWRRARESRRARMLLFALGPALVLPLLLLIAILPVGVHPNLLFRSIWAAPVLFSLALGLSELVRPSEGRLRIGIPGCCWLAAAALALGAIHYWGPDRFAQWDEALPLLALGFLVALGLLIWSRARAKSLPVRLACALPLLFASCYQGAEAVIAGPAEDAARDFAAQLGSKAIARLAAEDSTGHVASGTVLSAHLTALAGAQVLGAHKVAYTDYRPEHRRMQKDLVRLLKSRMDLGRFVETLEEHSVTHACVMPERCASFAGRLARLPLLFPVLEDDRGIRLYGVALDPETRRLQAEELVRNAVTARPLVAARLYRDAELLAGKGALPADAVRAHADALKDLRRKVADDLAAKRLRSASRPYLLDPVTCSARRKCADELLTAGRLREEAIPPAEMGIIARPIPRDGESDRGKLRKAFPLAISRANEPRVSVGLPDAKLLTSVRVKVRTSQAWRHADFVRLVLRSRGQPECSFEMKPVGTIGKDRTLEYVAKVPVLLAEGLEVRIFTEHGYTMSIRELAVSALEESRTGEK